MADRIQRTTPIDSVFFFLSRYLFYQAIPFTNLETSEIRMKRKNGNLPFSPVSTSSSHLFYNVPHKLTEKITRKKILFGSIDWVARHAWISSNARSSENKKHQSKKSKSNELVLHNSPPPLFPSPLYSLDTLSTQRERRVRVKRDTISIYRDTLLTKYCLTRKLDEPLAR